MHISREPKSFLSPCLQIKVINSTSQLILNPDNFFFFCKTSECSEYTYLEVFHRHLDNSRNKTLLAQCKQVTARPAPPPPPHNLFIATLKIMIPPMGNTNVDLA